MANSKRNGAKKTKLPKGISELPSGSYRVQISRKGHAPIRETFHCSRNASKHDKEIVIAEADAWATKTRLSLRRGTFTAAGPVDELTVRDALEKFRAEVTSKKEPKLARRDRNRINSMLEEAWSDKFILDFKRADVLNFIEDLKRCGWDKSYNRKLTKLKKELADLPARNTAKAKELVKQIKNLETLKSLHASHKSVKNSERKSDLEIQIREIEEVEGIKEAAPTTIRNKLSLLSSALKYSTKMIDGYQSPVVSEDIPGNNPGRERRLAGDEETRLINAAQESELQHLELLIKMAIHTALRLGRLLSLKWSYIEDVKWGARTHTVIKIPQNIQHHNKRAGTIPVTGEIQKLLDQIKKLSSGELLFPISDDQVEYHFRVARQKAGIEDFRFHDLRHEATSRLFEHGLDAVQVMSITGHTTNQMLDRYTHYPAVRLLDQLNQAQGVANDLDVLKNNFAHAAQTALRAGITMEELEGLLPTKCCKLNSASC